ncbi:hypothetical protein R83H12_01189 [Fibrobacteria bacterium R8-3-H12]
MRDKFSKIALAAILGFALAFTFSCSSDDGGDDTGGNFPSSGSVPLPSSSSVAVTETYYWEIGGISVKAMDLINSTPGISAKDVLKYLNQYPVIPDKYKSVGSGASRAEIENAFDNVSVSISGFSKVQTLRTLDTDGYVLFTFTNAVSDWIYFYVEKNN